MNKLMLKKQYMMYAPKKKGRLPSGFQEVEYIQSTGTQYLNTGLTPNGNYSFDIKINASTNKKSILGALEAWEKNAISLYINDYNNLLWSFANKSKQATKNSFPLNTDIQITSNRGTLTVGNEVVILDNASFNYTGRNIVLFGTNGPLGPVEFASMKLYYCKWYDGNTLIRDFIPCYRKSDNEVGLYDIVNNQFYTNSGSGTFQCGRPLVYDTIQGYQQVDYIEKQYSASNSSYFDSGIPASNDLVVEAELFNELGTQDGSCAVFGSRVGFKNKDYTLNFANAVSNGTKYDSRFGSNAYNYGDYLVEYPNNYHILTWGNGALKINGETKLTMTNDSFQSTLNVFLFAGNSNGSVGFYEGSGKTKVKWLKMTKNGVLVRNFIPMKRTSDNEVGMYDLVTNTFYTNAGSGSFIAGRDIINIDGYRQVEYIQGSGSAYIDLGVKSRSGLTIIVDDHLMRDTSGEAIVSGGDAWDVNFLQMGLGGWTNYNSQIYKTNHYLVLTRCIYKVDDSGVYINDVLKQSWTPTSWNSTYNLFAFASNRGGTLSDFSKNERLYKLEILENGVHIRDFYPVEEISTGKVGLYDVVSKRFFPSETSTNFIKGDYI